MRKIYLILLVIVITIIVILSGIYVYANYEAKESYNNYVHKCNKEGISQYKELMSPKEFEVRVTKNTKLQNCFNAGGCFELCGSGCGLLKPTKTFSEILFGGPKICPAVCRSGCLYPVE